MATRWWTQLIAAPIAAVLVMAACTEEVVVEGAGGATHAGGSGVGGSTTDGCTTTTTATGVGPGLPSGTGCSDSQWYLDKWFPMAIACLPQCGMPQCTGDTVIYTECGCPIVANDLTPDLAEKAVNAYEGIVNSCGWPPCTDSCPPGPEVPHFCDPATNSCEPE